MPPKVLVPWLSSNGSLTEQVKLYDHNARVVVLSEQWHERLFERQILMLCYDQPWWYAKTVIPAQAYLKRKQAFTNLNTDSLGTILFRDPGIRFLNRKVIQIQADILNSFSAFPVVNSNADITLWGRASAYSIDNSAALYLTEVFLPAMVGAL